MDEFILRALISIVFLAAALGPLGSFVVWRHMAYFGDTIAHSALLGVAISLLSNERISMPLAMFLVAISIALILTRFARDTRFHADTILGILAHSALALGVLLVALSGSIRVDINAYLFGDILGVSWTDVAILAAVCSTVLLVLYRQWRPLLITTIEPNIAAVSGMNVARTQLLLTLMLASIIALAIKLTGVLLITALLIIPAAAARYLSSTPRQMAFFASLIGMFAALAGLFTSLKLDAPTGPMMVVCAAGMFILCSLLKRRA